MFCQVCWPGDKQTTFKMLVPWMECYAVLWHIFKTDSIVFLVSSLPSVTAPYFSCLGSSRCVILQFLVSTNVCPRLSFMNVLTSVTWRSWCGCENQCQSRHSIMWKFQLSSIFSARLAQNFALCHSRSWSLSFHVMQSCKLFALHLVWTQHYWLVLIAVTDSVPS